MVAMWKKNIRAKPMLEFGFYSTTVNLEVFQQLWGHEGVLCWVSEQGLLKLSNYFL